MTGHADDDVEMRRPDNQRLPAMRFNSLGLPLGLVREEKKLWNVHHVIMCLFGEVVGEGRCVHREGAGEHDERALHFTLVP